MLIITLVFEKNANFFRRTLSKSQKIVIITSTPGRPAPQQQLERDSGRIFRQIVADRNFDDKWHLFDFGANYGLMYSHSFVC
jgi:hypothetical protein